MPWKAWLPGSNKLPSLSFLRNPCASCVLKKATFLLVTDVIELARKVHLGLEKWKEQNSSTGKTRMNFLTNPVLATCRSTLCMSRLFKSGFVNTRPRRHRSKLKLANTSQRCICLSLALLNKQRSGWYYRSEVVLKHPPAESKQIVSTGQGERQYQLRLQQNPEAHLVESSQDPPKKRWEN